MITLEQLRAELAPMRAQLDGLPIIGRKLSVIQQDLRSLRTAFNDFARTNVTSGEIEALHTDVDATMAKQTELEMRLATIERLMKKNTP
jgi:hypothetical protein